jgi:hypothetical protein
MLKLVKLEVKLLVKRQIKLLQAIDFNKMEI